MLLLFWGSRPGGGGVIGSLAATAYVSYQTSEWADKEAKALSGDIYDALSRRM
ncbi:hypothetical protein [Vibrio cincinnatiensis]|uniref:hypothetical protein n=1 Tax=Vibrio cincinnatiensis TaxID=675 RepID=UPI0038A10B02